jgi:hypothetical protein
LPVVAQVVVSKVAVAVVQVVIEHLHCQYHLAPLLLLQLAGELQALVVKVVTDQIRYFHL